MVYLTDEETNDAMTLLQKKDIEIFKLKEEIYVLKNQLKNQKVKKIDFELDMLRKKINKM